MKIRRLELENIGCYVSRSFDFDDLTVVRGENRTGKSTLIYALFFALFGTHLHNGLNTSDLCRKGQTFGSAVLDFEAGGRSFRLKRSTQGGPVLYSRSAGSEDWRPDIPDQPQTDPIGISAEVAALTSFFREGELIYFLQDIPRYNKTLLQNLVQMDDVLIVQSRFKKALVLAREENKALHQACPQKEVTALSLEEQRKQAEAFEAERSRMDAELKNMSEYAGKAVDPNLFKLLQQRRDEKAGALEAASAQRKQLPGLSELAGRLKEVEAYLAAGEKSAGSSDALQRRLGELERGIRDIDDESGRLRRLESQARCAVCGQPIPKQRLSELISELAGRKEEAEKSLQSTRRDLQNALDAERRLEAARRELETLRRKIPEARRLEEQIGDLKAQLLKSDEELHQYQALTQNLKDPEKHFQRLRELEEERARLEGCIINARVAVRQMEQDLALIQECSAKFDQSRQHMLMCNIACQAVDYAVQSLNRSLLEKVRRSISEWAGRFTFLREFDIELGPQQISPIIQARGYQYKLNQMSKSERIFLYLLLKLAIGDALSHLGVFILDDPADGLDLKRKRMLAQLLTEISPGRQIVVTTNDESFADQFSDGSRIDLDSAI